MQILRGTGIVLTFTLVGLLLSFFCKLLIARFGTEAQYGTFSLALALLTIVGSIATLGLVTGLSRNIAVAVAREDNSIIREYVFASIVIVTVASLLVATMLFLFSGFISGTIFHDDQLRLPLQILAVALPFFAGLNLGIAILQGFKRVSGRAIFQYLVLYSLFIFILVCAYYAKISFVGVFYAYLTALVITVLLLALYAKRALGISWKITLRGQRLFTPAAIELFKFSLPLLLFELLIMFGTWIDTLMLGVFKSSGDVGLYNVALPLSLLITVPINAVAFIYLPVISGLHAQGRTSEIEQNMTLMTKWICLVALPIAFVFLLFPETTISLTFGAKYMLAGNALRILSLGAILLTTTMLAMQTVIAFGHSRFIMASTCAMVALDVTLDVLLIPRFSIEGAATASVTALAFWQVLCCLKLYSVGRIHPFSQNLLKPLGVALGVVVVLYYTLLPSFHGTYLTLPLFFLLFVALYGLALLFTRSLDEQDLDLATTIADKIGIDIEWVKQIMMKFV
jgi:O-antigen/teichoic acid export membrane protein